MFFVFCFVQKKEKKRQVATPAVYSRARTEVFVLLIPFWAASCAHAPLGLPEINANQVENISAEFMLLSNVKYSDNTSQTDRRT